LLAPLSNAVVKVTAELSNEERLHKSKIHPIAVLSALKTYAQGKGERGQNTWTPVQQIVDALDAAFYKSFANVETTGKRWMLALDVSGSMECGTIAGIPGLTPRIASGAMALVTAAKEPNHMILGFSHYLVDVPISPKKRLDDACRVIGNIPMGGTDCALPMGHAITHKIPVDAFVIFTDNETWFGDIHPCQNLKKYRDKMGIPAKLIVVGMTSSGFTIADPEDAGSMDVVGFDAAAPSLMSDFVVS
jgi:60 kDa SS-A/Ro ribonucleoprotein